MPGDVECSKTTETDGTQHRLIVLISACLLGFAIALAWLGQRASNLSWDVEVASTWLVVLSIPIGLVYLLGVRRFHTRRVGGLGLGVIIAGGMVMRAAVIASPPILEDDFYRYLWDGAVTAHGLNPYDYAPTHVLWASVGADTVQAQWLPLAEEAGVVLERVNHPSLTTIYPPIAQLCFAFAHVLGPWSTVSLRFLLLIADGLTLLILLLVLSDLRLPLVMIAWYWWNPILLREVYGAAHMDVLVLPFLMLAVRMAMQDRIVWSMLLLSFAGGVKLWPLLLAPILVRPVFASPRRLLFAGTTLVISTLLIWTPTFPEAFGPHSGFLAYAAQWRNNAGAFSFLEALAGWTPWIADGSLRLSSGAVTRLVVVALLGGWIVQQARRSIQDGRDILRRCLLVVAAIFLLSPTQFPWYFVWMTPFLAVTPNAAILAYSALLPLYHLRDLHSAVLWVEHLPVWLLLIGGLLFRSGFRKEPQSAGFPAGLEVTT